MGIMQVNAARARHFLSRGEAPGTGELPITERLTEGVRTALANAGLPEPETCVWEVPRQAEHGDYATNVAMTLARAARRPPRQVAELIVKHFPSLREVERLDVAGPGFLNVFLSPAWCTGALGEILEAGAAYGRGQGERGRRVRLEFVSANPTGPLVIVRARAAAPGESLARLLRERHLAEKVLEGRAARKLTYEHEGALWFRSSELGEEAGDDKDRVLRRSTGEATYFAVDVAYHHYVKFQSADRVINLFGPDHHGYVPRMKAAMRALGHPPDAFEVLIVQLVTLLRDGQPVRMSKRRGEFVLMEELLEEVGRDAARFTFLTRRHDSPLEFDLAVATRQSAENPGYYVQYAQPRIASIYQHAAEQGIVVPPLGEVDLSPLREGEEIAIIKRLVQYPEIVRGAARALEPHRVAYWLRELAGVFHPYYKNHRVILDDRRLMFARLALCTGVGRVIRNGLELLGVSAPESM